jgi:hypothetical protein
MVPSQSGMRLTITCVLMIDVLSTFVAGTLWLGKVIWGTLTVVSIIEIEIVSGPFLLTARTPSGLESSTPADNELVTELVTEFIGISSWAHSLCPNS